MHDVNEHDMADFGARLNATPLLVPCRFRIPTHYNCGKPVQPEVWDDIYKALSAQFGGYTVLGTTQGNWGEQTETSVGVEVAVPPELVPEVRRVVVGIGRILKQSAMYFDCPAPSVEIIGTQERRDVTEDDTEDDDGLTREFRWIDRFRH